MLDLRVLDIEKGLLEEEDLGKISDLIADSDQLNNVMKTLTVVATVLISVQVVTGIYGMNFRYMPELHWRYGYAFALGLMVATAGVLLHYFRKIRWL